MFLCPRSAVRVSVHHQSKQHRALLPPCACDDRCLKPYVRQFLFGAVDTRKKKTLLHFDSFFDANAKTKRPTQASKKRTHDGARTRDHQVKSLALSRLSYAG